MLPWSHCFAFLPNLPAAPLTGAQIVAKCKETSIFPWSAQAALTPIPIVRYAHDILCRHQLIIASLSLQYALPPPISSDHIYFWDADGKKYADMNSQLMCSNIGHNNQTVIKAVQDQVAELPFAAPSFATKPRAELGDLLREVTPSGLNKFFYTLGGAEAVENAVKFARFHTGTPLSPCPATPS